MVNSTSIIRYFLLYLFSSFFFLSYVFFYSISTPFYSIVFGLFFDFWFFYLFLFTEKSITDFTSHFFSNGFTIFTVLKPLNSICNFAVQKCHTFLLFFLIFFYFFLQHAWRRREENGFIFNDVMLEIAYCKKISILAMSSFLSPIICSDPRTSYCCILSSVIDFEASSVKCYEMM